MKCRKSLLFMVSLGLVMTQALPAADPVAKVPEKKITPEEPLLKKAEITESSPAIAVEGAEEPKQADRAKKSASTTFCVEIRPGPSEAPVKVCDQPPPPPPPPQVPQEAHEVHEQPPPPPAYIQEPQSPVFIIPQSHSEIFIPNEPSPPQQSYLHFPQIFHQPPPPPQQVVIPSVVSNPCPPPQQTIVIPGSVPNPYPPQPSAPQQTIVIPGPAPGSYPAPPSSQQTIVIPGFPQHPYPQSPCPPSPCATAGAGIHPHAMLALFRSANGPMNGLSLNGMEMRSSNDQATMEFLKEASSMDSADGMAARMDSGDSARMDSGDSMVSKMDPNQEVETVGTSLYRTHTKKPVGQQASLYPLYSSTAINERSPYVIRCNPQVLALSNGGSAYVVATGRGRSSEMNLMDSNGQPMMAADGPVAMGMPQARHHVIQPYISGGGYSSHSMIPSVVQHTTYQSYPSSVESYPIHQHAVVPGYSVHHRPSVIVPSIEINSHPGVITPGHSSSIYRMGSEQRYQQAKEKSWNSEAEQRASMDQQMSRSQQYGAMSPSRMLEHMRGNSASSGFIKRPMMQTFPRMSEEKSNGPCNTAKITVPRGAQSFLISDAMDEKNADKDDDDANHEDMAKRETEKIDTDKN